MDIDVMDAEWFVVGDPWLPRDCMPYVIAGSNDPHIGTPVFDITEPDDHYLDEQEQAAGFAIAEHIVGMHNNALKKRRHKRGSTPAKN